MIVFVLLIGLAALLTFASLLRGLSSFSHEQTMESRSKQSKMMAARVKWQAIAVLIIVIVGYSYS